MQVMVWMYTASLVSLYVCMLDI